MHTSRSITRSPGRRRRSSEHDVPDVFTPVIPLENQRLSEAIAEYLALAVRNGEFPPGYPLPSERSLVKRFGVSRTVLREALILLQQAGIVYTRQGSGTVVISGGGDPLLTPEMDPAAPTFDAQRAPMATVNRHVMREEFAIAHGGEELTWMFELRMSLEGEAAALGASRANKNDKQQLLKALHGLSDDGSGARSALAADFDFHLAIARMTGNRYFVNTLTKVLHVLAQPLHLSRVRSSAEAGTAHAIWREHAAIYRHIIEHDPSAAREAMRKHLNAAHARVVGVDLLDSD